MREIWAVGAVLGGRVRVERKVVRLKVGGGLSVKLKLERGCMVSMKIT